MLTLNKSRNICILLLIVFSAFLRIYKLDIYLAFHGELGHNYLAVRNLLEGGVIPLIGPPTSHSWLSFGPLFYWFISPVLYFGRFDPYWPALAITLLHVFLIPVAFVFVNKQLSWKSAIVTAALLSLSPVFIQYSRDARFFSIVLLIFWPFLYSLIKKHYLLTFFLFSIMLNFHLTPLVLLPGIVIYLFSLKQRSNLKKNFIRSGVGLLVPQIPYLMHLIFNSPTTILKIIAWIPYRIAGFIGIIPKNNISSEVINANNQSIIEFFSSIFSPQNNFALAAFVALVVIYYFLKVKGIVHRLVKILFITSLAAVFIHGDPPSHYYLPILPLLVLIVSNSVKDFNPRLIIVALVIMFVFNSNYYFGEDLRFKHGLIPYNRQKEVVTNILEDAKGASIHLKRVGPYDHFEEDYAQNYQYLAWLYGNKPVNAEHAQVIYTIYEKEGVITYQKDE